MHPVDDLVRVAQGLAAAEGGGVVFAVGGDGAGGGLPEVGGGGLAGFAAVGQVGQEEAEPERPWRCTLR